MEEYQFKNSYGRIVTIKSTSEYEAWVELEKQEQDPSDFKLITCQETLNQKN